MLDYSTLSCLNVHLAHSFVYFCLYWHIIMIFKHNKIINFYVILHPILPEPPTTRMTTFQLQIITKLHKLWQHKHSNLLVLQPYKNLYHQTIPIN